MDAREGPEDNAESTEGAPAARATVVRRRRGKSAPEQDGRSARVPPSDPARPHIAPPGSASAAKERDGGPLPPPGPEGTRGRPSSPARPGRAGQPGGGRGKIKIAPPGSSSAHRRDPRGGEGEHPDRVAPRPAVDLHARPAPRDPPRKPTYRPPPPSARPHRTEPAPRETDNRTRRAKQLLEKMGEVHADRGPAPGLRAAVSVVLIGRNHAEIVPARLTGLRETVTAIDSAWWVLDLGSVDGTVAAAESERARVIRVPGGQVEPLQTLDLAMAACGGDVVVFFDAACARESVVTGIIERVREGAPLALVDARLPGAMAVSRRAWERRHFAGHFDLQEWAVGLGRVAIVQAPGSCLDKRPDAALLPRALDRRRRRVARRALWAVSQRLHRIAPGRIAKRASRLLRR